MTNELSKERAIEALYTVRAYYASLTAGYPKGKDCRGIGDVMCSEIANSCLMAIKALEQQPCETIHGSTYGGVSWGGTYKPQQPCENCISRDEAIRVAEQGQIQGYEWQFKKLCALPSVTPRPKGKWIQTKDDCDGVNFYDFSFKCTECGKEQSFKSNYCLNCGADMAESEGEE